MFDFGSIFGSLTDVFTGVIGTFFTDLIANLFGGLLG